MIKSIAISIILLLISALPLSANSNNVGLKISSEKNWINWGDYILGHDLKAGIESFGYSVFDSYIGDFYPKADKDTDINIFMHGFVPFNPVKNENKFNVLYLYYPLETANMNKYKNLENVSEPSWYSLQTELWNFDLIAVASPSYMEKLEKFGIPTIYAPQFTNPDKFYYEYDERMNYNILFVGRPGYERISALWAIESGFDVALFGSGWQGIAPEQFKGDYIDNNELHKYYSSAKIVLNDTRNDMKNDGFISNRVFDVTASRGFLISDYMPEIEKFYGDSIPMFKTKEELKHLIEYYLDHPDERIEKAKKAQEITLKYFTNKAVAKNIFDKIESIKKEIKTEEKTNSMVILKSPWPENSSLIGDYWLGIDMEKGLVKNRLVTKNYYYNNGFHVDEFYKKADNLLYLQFKYNHIDFEDKKKAKIIYLYFPTFIPDRGKFANTKENIKFNTDVHLNNDLEFFDYIATPAKNIFYELKDKKYSAEYVPQFTNTEKFYYDYDIDKKTELLFVGSTWYDRVSALYAVELGYDVSIYGLNWNGKIPDKFIKGEFIDNNELRKYYSSAKIVLSDHADDLSDIGLVANRLYDATACGAFVISEYSPYIEEIFGDSIPMFKTKEEFKELVDYYLAHPEERKIKAKLAQDITLNSYTNTIIANHIKDIFRKIHEDRK